MKIDDITAGAIDIELRSGTGTSNAVALTIANESRDHSNVANGFGSRIQFQTNRGTQPASVAASADIKGYIYSGAGSTGDFHALDLDVYGDNSVLNRGISILSQSATAGTPANVVIHGNLGIGKEPDYTLEVDGELRTKSNVFLDVMNTHEREGTVRFGRADGGDRVHNIKVYNSSTQADNYLKFQVHAGGASTGTVTDNVLYLRGDGNVGLGTATPTEKLHVHGNAIATDLIANQHVSIGTNLHPTLGGHWLTIVSPTFDNAIGDNHPDPDGGILFTNASSTNYLPWGYYMGVVKDVAGTNGTTQRLDIGKSSSLNSQLTTTGTDTLTPYLTIDNGSVGIGTTSPSTKIHVHTTDSANVGGTEGDFVGTHDTTEMFRMTGGGNVGDVYAISAAFKIGGDYPSTGSSPHGRLDIYANTGSNSGNDYGLIPDTHVASFRGDGKVGIGVSNPAYTLDVDGDVNLSSGSTLRINGTPAVFSNWTTASGSNIYRSSGNVGIGVSNPGYKLDVAGDANVEALTASSFVTERVIFRESWPNASLVGDLGTWVSSGLVTDGTGYGTTPDGHRSLKFKDDGTLTSAAFDLRKYALVDTSHATDAQTKTCTRVFLKAWLNSTSLDNEDTDPYMYIEFSPDNGTTWHKVYSDNSNEDSGTDAGWKMAVADLSPYINATSTQCKIRFSCNAPGAGDFYKIGRIFIYESGVPTNLGGMWLGTDGNIGVGTTSPSTYKLNVNGSLRAVSWITADTGIIANATSSRDKLRVWNQSHYSIGMESGITFGALNDYGMTFQMSNTDYRGFWWGDSSHSKAQGAMSLTTTGHLTVAERLKVGDGQSSTSGPSYTLHTVSNDTVGDANYYGAVLRHVCSGSDTLSTIRTHYGLYLDMDSSASGGDTTNQHRMLGISADVRHTGSSDYVRGMSSYVVSEHTSGTCTYLWGGNFQAVASGTGTNAYVYGAETLAYKDPGSTGTTTSMFGVKPQVRVDGGTCTNAYGVQSYIYENGGTITNGFCFYGLYTGEATNKWGVYITGETKNYFSGRLGIGTNNPQSLLHISSGTSGDAHLIIEADTDNNNESDNPKIVFRQDGGSYEGEIGLDNNRMVFRSKSSNDGNTGFAFYSNVSSSFATTLDDLETTQIQVMRITGDGNVGIGTTSPDGKFHIYQSAGSTNLVDKRTSRSTTDYAQHVNYTHYASVAEGASRNPDNSRGLWVGNFVDENDGSPSGANFMAFTNSFTFYGVDDNTEWDSDLSFTSNTDNLKYSATGFFTKCVRIDADGSVGIGTTSPGYTLDVHGTSNVGALTATSLTADDLVVYAASSYGRIEVGGPSGAYIDLKGPATDDYDMRFMTTGTGGLIAIGGVGYDSMTFDGSGNVGIGTDSPGAKLHLFARDSANVGTTQGDNVGTHDTTEMLRMTGLGDAGDVNSISTAFKIGGDYPSGSSPHGRLDIYANNGGNAGNAWGTTPDGHIASFRGDGSVGIGTTSPGYTLDVRGSSNVGALTATSGAFTGNGDALLVGTGGKLGLTINDGDGNANLTFNHASRTPDSNGSSGRIDCGVDGTSGYMRLRVKNNVTAGTSTGNLPDCMRIEEGFVRAYSDLYVDDNVGIKTTSPGAVLDVRAGTNDYDPSTPTVHIGDGVVDQGDYGMVNLVRHQTSGGSKAHLAFIRNGNTVFGMGFHNNTNTFGFWPGFSAVTNAPAMAMDTGGSVGIGTTSPTSIFNVFGGNLWDGSDHTSKVCATFHVGRGGGSGTQTEDQGTGAIIELRHSNGDYRYVTIESVSEATYSQDIGIRFKTVDESTGPEERMRIDAHGNVGIGVTDPDQKLEVRGNIKASYTNSDHGMLLDASGTIRRDYGGAGAGLHFTNNEIRPTNYLGTYSAGGVNLGNGSYRWNNVYTEALNASGDLVCRLVRPNYTDQSTISGAIAYRINNSNDNYVRFCSDTGAIRTFLDVPTRTGGNASGTWGISITGNAATASAVTGKSQISKTAPTFGSNDYHLELYSGNTGDASKEIALRFQQSNNYWHSIRAKNTGFYFTDGYSASTLSAIHCESVGIGITSTQWAKLHVDGYRSSTMTSGSLSYFTHGYGLSYTSSSTWTNYATSIFATDDIISRGYILSSSGNISVSDSRIKKNIVDADDAECLEVLRQLKPKKYQYKDTIKRGEEPVWGFIAQEVRDTLPYATKLRQDFIPNIYELASVSQSNVITFTNFNTSNLESNATTLIQTTGIDGKEHRVHLVEVIDDHTIRVEEDLSEWIGSVDETGNVVTGNQLFVHGQQVNDFVFLKKESIFTVATAALQEVDRQQQADKARIAELETQLASVLARLDALENPPS